MLLAFFQDGVTTVLSEDCRSMLYLFYGYGKLEIGFVKKFLLFSDSALQCNRSAKLQEIPFKNANTIGKNKLHIYGRFQYEVLVAQIAIII